MRWLKAGPRRGGAESVQQTTAEPVQATSGEVESTPAEAALQAAEPSRSESPTMAVRRTRLLGAVAYAVLPALALLLAGGAGFLKWQDNSVRDARQASVESVRAATENTIALLSYKPDTVQRDLEAARSRLTGTFLNAYTQLTHDVVIPGSQQRQISATATVPAAASVKATPRHAVVLLFVDQSIVIGQDAPTSTASSVRVTLDKVGDQWLISQFDPV